MQEHYDRDPQREWDRAERHPFEFELTRRVMHRYIDPRDTILDIGGGPGRYSIYFANQGNKVTLVDLSPQNVMFARNKAGVIGVPLEAHACSCLDMDSLGLGTYDHVFLMGPMYHLLEDQERIKAVEQALKHVRVGGKLYVSFISVYAGLIYYLQHPGAILEDAVNPKAADYLDITPDVIAYINRGGFTLSRFSRHDDNVRFMERFPLVKLRYFGQEGMLAPNHEELLTRSEEEINLWLDIAERFLDAPQFLSWSEHALYIGMKK